MSAPWNDADYFGLDATEAREQARSHRDALAYDGLSFFDEPMETRFTAERARTFAAFEQSQREGAGARVA